MRTAIVLFIAIGVPSGSLALACSSAAPSTIDGPNQGSPPSEDEPGDEPGDGDEPDAATRLDANAADAKQGDAKKGDASKVDGTTSTGHAAVVQVALGHSHACALLDGGRVKCWGKNSNGQLGIGDDASRGMNPGEMGAALPAVNLGTGRTAKALALLDGTSCALLDDGTVKCWGDMKPLTGLDAQLGVDPTQMGDALPALALPKKVTSIAAGYQHVCVVLEDATTRCFGGSNFSGQLGVGDTTPHPASATLPPVSMGAGRTALTLAPSTYHTCARLDDGSVKCWGRNIEGELGLGDKLERTAPTTTVDLGPGRTAVAIAASAGPILATVPVGYTCAVLDDGSVKCWGLDTAGLGVGNVTNVYANKGDEPGEMGAALSAVNLGTGRTAKSVSVGMSLYPFITMTCALLDDDTVKCWGANENGTLGVGDKSPRGKTLAQMGDALAPIDLGPGAKVKSVVVAPGWTKDLTACAVLDDDRIKCWGGNKYGQLGLGDTALRGATPGEMGAALPRIDLGP